MYDVFNNQNISSPPDKDINYSKKLTTKDILWIGTGFFFFGLMVFFFLLIGMGCFFSAFCFGTVILLASVLLWQNFVKKDKGYVRLLKEKLPLFPPEENAMKKNSISPNKMSPVAQDYPQLFAVSDLEKASGDSSTSYKNQTISRCESPKRDHYSRSDSETNYARHSARNSVKRHSPPNRSSRTKQQRGSRSSNGKECKAISRDRRGKNKLIQAQFNKPSPIHIYLPQTKMYEDLKIIADKKDIETHIHPQCKQDPKNKMSLSCERGRNLKITQDGLTGEPEFARITAEKDAQQAVDKLPYPPGTAFPHPYIYPPCTVPIFFPPCMNSIPARTTETSNTHEWYQNVRQPQNPRRALWDKSSQVSRFVNEERGEYNIDQPIKESSLEDKDELEIPTNIFPDLPIQKSAPVEITTNVNSERATSENSQNNEIGAEEIEPVPQQQKYFRECYCTNRESQLTPNARKNISRYTSTGGVNIFKTEFTPCIWCRRKACRRDRSHSKKSKRKSDRKATSKSCCKKYCPWPIKKGKMGAFDQSNHNEGRHLNLDPNVVSDEHLSKAFNEEMDDDGIHKKIRSLDQQKRENIYENVNYKHKSINSKKSQNPKYIEFNEGGSQDLRQSHSFKRVSKTSKHQRNFPQKQNISIVEPHPEISLGFQEDIPNTFSSLDKRSPSELSGTYNADGCNCKLSKPWRNDSTLFRRSSSNISDHFITEQTIPSLSAANTTGEYNLYESEAEKPFNSCLCSELKPWIQTEVVDIAQQSNDVYPLTEKNITRQSCKLSPQLLAPPISSFSRRGSELRGQTCGNKCCLCNNIGSNIDDIQQVISEYTLLKNELNRLRMEHGNQEVEMARGSSERRHTRSPSSRGSKRASRESKRHSFSVTLEHERSPRSSNKRSVSKSKSYRSASVSKSSHHSRSKGKSLERSPPLRKNYEQDIEVYRELDPNVILDMLRCMDRKIDMKQNCVCGAEPSRVSDTTLVGSLGPHPNWYIAQRPSKDNSILIDVFSNKSSRSRTAPHSEIRNQSNIHLSSSPMSKRVSPINSKSPRQESIERNREFIRRESKQDDFPDSKRNSKPRGNSIVNNRRESAKMLCSSPHRRSQQENDSAIPTQNQPYNKLGPVKPDFVGQEYKLAKAIDKTFQTWEREKKRLSGRRSKSD